MHFIAQNGRPSEVEVGWIAAIRGSIDAINAYINAGCPEPVSQADGYAESCPNGCPILPESND